MVTQHQTLGLMYPLDRRCKQIIVQVHRLLGSLLAGLDSRRRLVVSYIVPKGQFVLIKRLLVVQGCLEEEKPFEEEDFAAILHMGDLLLIVDKVMCASCPGVALPGVGTMEALQNRA